MGEMPDGAWFQLLSWVDKENCRQAMGLRVGCIWGGRMTTDLMYFYKPNEH